MRKKEQTYFSKSRHQICRCLDTLKDGISAFGKPARIRVLRSSSLARTQYLHYVTSRLPVLGTLRDRAVLAYPELAT